MNYKNDHRAMLIPSAAFLLSAAVSSGLAAERDEAWLKEASAHVLTPTSDRVAPVGVLRQEGKVESAEAMLAGDGQSCRLSFEKGGVKPVVVLDFGKQSVGGYAVFTVTAKTGAPVVRLSYACHPDGTGETGDFTRESSARYMGPTVDLPVLPANINRHEIYSIPRTGEFIAPLIQGQARYVRVQLDSPETAVDRRLWEFRGGSRRCGDFESSCECETAVVLVCCQRHAVLQSCRSV
jgi:hypothetical protein